MIRNSTAKPLPARLAESEERKPPYAIQYRHNGKTWGLTIWAESWEDAQARLRSIGFNGKIIGSNVETIPVNTLTVGPAAIWMAVVCWWRNFGKPRP